MYSGKRLKFIELFINELSAEFDRISINVNLKSSMNKIMDGTLFDLVK